MHANSNIAGTREHDIVERTHISLTSLTALEIHSRTNRGTSEGSETSADGRSTRRIHIYRVYFCWNPVFACFKNKGPNIDVTKTDTVDLDSPRRELFQRRSRNCRSPCCFFRELMLCRLVLGVQSSCMQSTHGEPTFIKK